jgi:hypothetical protein
LGRGPNVMNPKLMGHEIHAELAACASMLAEHLAHLHLRCYLSDARAQKNWNHKQLHLVDESGWFTARYLEPLRQARALIEGDAREREWWNEIVERCMDTDNAVLIDVQQRTIRYGYYVLKGVKHVELAVHVLLFYRTMARALEEHWVDARTLYPALEQARQGVLEGFPKK